MRLDKVTGLDSTGIFTLVEARKKVEVGRAPAPAGKRSCDE
jgi:hypothetical protein